MQVKQIMTSEIATCRPDTNVAVIERGHHGQHSDAALGSRPAPTRSN
jgi:hypothetical protein